MQNTVAVKPHEEANILTMRMIEQSKKSQAQMKILSTVS